MEKIIQITANDIGLHALTEDGKVYARKSREEQICKGNPLREETRWSKVTSWNLIEDERVEEFTRVGGIPF